MLHLSTFEQVIMWAAWGLLICPWNGLNKSFANISSRFEKTIVKSSARLTYEDAQNMIDNKISDRKKFAQSKGINMKTLNEMIKKIKIMKKIASEKRKIRTNA